MAGISLGTGRVFTGNVNMATRESILTGVGALYLKSEDSILLADILKAVSRISNYKKRNDLVHGYWLPTKDFITAISQHQPRRNPTLEFKKWTVYDIEEVGNEVSDFIMELTELSHRLREVLPEPPPSHDP